MELETKITIYKINKADINIYRENNGRYEQNTKTIWDEGSDFWKNKKKKQKILRESTRNGKTRMRLRNEINKPVDHKQENRMESVCKKYERKYNRENSKIPIIKWKKEDTARVKNDQTA